MENNRWITENKEERYFLYLSFVVLYKVSKKNHLSSVGGMNCSILNEGLRNISAGTVDYTDGADVIPTRRLSAMKSEGHKFLVFG